MLPVSPFSDFRRTAVSDLDPSVAPRQSEESLNSIVEGLPGGAVVILDGEVVVCNKAVEEIWGYPRERFLGTSPIEYLHPDDRARAGERIKKVVAGGPTELGEYLAVRTDGDVVPVEISSAHIVFQGKPAIVSVIRDVSERNKQNEAILESETRLVEAQRLSHVGSWEWGITEDRITWSEELYRIYGLDPNDFAASYEAFLERVHPEDRERTDSSVRAALQTGEPFLFDERIVRPDGSVRVLESRGRVITDSDGRPVKMIGACHDVTERKKAEESVQRSRDQLRALHSHVAHLREEERIVLARELHDEIGQTMVAIQLHLSGLRAQDLPEEAAERLERASELVESVVQMGGRISTCLRPGVLDGLGLLTAIKCEVEEFGERSGLECELLLNVEKWDGDLDRATALYRILQESLTNVARHSGATRVWVSIEDEDGVIVLRVEDNGRGFEADRIQSSRNLGVLGMQERALAWGGTVSIQGVPDEGTTVVARIPV